MIHKIPVMILKDDTDDADENVDAKAGRVTGRVALPTAPPASKLLMFVSRDTVYDTLYDRYVI